MLLIAWQKPGVQALAYCHPNSVCSYREDAASYEVIWDKEGTNTVQLPSYQTLLP